MRSLWLALLLPVCAAAQSDETDVGEVAGYAGLAAGIGTHAAVGASFATALSRYHLGFLDVAYAPLGSDALRGPFSGITRSHLYDFNGGVHVRAPVTQRFAPYLVVAAGLLHSRFSARLPERISLEDSDNDFAFHAGVGARYYITDKWGVRPEYRYSVTERNFSRFVVGVFYQFP